MNMKRRTLERTKDSSSQGQALSKGGPKKFKKKGGGVIKLPSEL